jgi:hypothetical protein
MAERYAVTTGLWTAATFNGGTLPTIGDTVHANGYAVTVDQDITVAALSTRIGVTAAAGGVFQPSGSRTIYASLYSGTTTCVNVATATGTVTVVGNFYGSDTTAGMAAIRNSGTGAGSPVVILHGNAYGDIGHGVIHAGKDSPLYLYGDSVGGVAYSCYGLTATGASTGHAFIYGTARSPSAGVGAGVNGGTTNSSCIFIQAAEQGAGGGWHSQGKVLFNDFNNIAFGVRNAAGTLKTIGVLPHSSFSTPRAFA